MHTLLFFCKYMIVYYLFVHKKSVSKRKVCINFIKNLQFKKTQKNPKNPFLVGFFRWVFLGFFGWVFLGGFFNANPAFTYLSRRCIILGIFGTGIYWNFLEKILFFFTSGWKGSGSGSGSASLDADPDPGKIMPIRPDPDQQTGLRTGTPCVM